MSRPIRWLILAHSFNADGKAASQTITDKIPALVDAGIELTIISAATGTKDKKLHHIQRMPWGPSGWRFDFRHIMQRRFGRGVLYRVTTLVVSVLLLPFIAVERLVFGLGNQASWALPAAVTGLGLARRGEVDLIYSTGGAASAHHAAAVIKARFGLPWIAEIHDPMVVREDASDDGTRPRKSRNARYLQRLEARICREADLVWWFTPAAMEYARLRTPALGEKGLVVLPGARQPTAAGRHVYGNTLDINHFGAISDSRSLAPLIEALAALVRERPEVASAMRVHSWGSALDAASLDALASTKLEPMVVVHDRQSRDDANRIMHESDVLLMLHGDYEWCAEYVPSKIYEYFWTDRPILAVTNRNPWLDELLQAHNAYIGHTLDKTSMIKALNEIWDDWKDQNLHKPAGVPVTVESAVKAILTRVDALT